MDFSSLRRSANYGLADLDDTRAQDLVGGVGVSSPLAGGIKLVPAITVAPTIFVAPLLTKSTNSFNFIGNNEAFNGSTTVVG